MKLQILFDVIEGLSIGDAFGQCFFSLASGEMEERVASRTEPPASWLFTDDTLMFLSVAMELSKRGAIDQDALAGSFAEHYSFDRAYGPSMHRALARIAEGEHWRVVSTSLFDGNGSFGNGAAMRSTPIGAWFFDDDVRLVEQARLAAEVTHSHSEGIAGAIAVAAATAVAVRALISRSRPSHGDLFEQVLRVVPDGEVADKLRMAQSMDRATSARYPASVLGSGRYLSAGDTVPFALWYCGQSLENFPNALWLAVEGGVDRDTICAIVGGVVAAFVGSAGIPCEWRSRREPLPEWFTADPSVSEHFHPAAVSPPSSVRTSPVM